MKTLDEATEKGDGCGVDDADQSSAPSSPGRRRSTRWYSAPYRGRRVVNADDDDPDVERKEEKATSASDRPLYDLTDEESITDVESLDGEQNDESDNRGGYWTEVVRDTTWFGSEIIKE